MCNVRLTTKGEGLGDNDMDGKAKVISSCDQRNFSARAEQHFPGISTERAKVRDSRHCERKEEPSVGDKVRLFGNILMTRLTTTVTLELRILRPWLYEEFRQQSVV